MLRSVDLLLGLRFGTNYRYLVLGSSGRGLNSRTVGTCIIATGTTRKISKMTSYIHLNFILLAN